MSPSKTSGEPCKLYFWPVFFRFSTMSKNPLYVLKPVLKLWGKKYHCLQITDSDAFENNARGTGRSTICFLLLFLFLLEKATEIIFANIKHEKIWRFNDFSKFLWKWPAQLFYILLINSDRNIWFLIYFLYLAC